MKINQKIYLLVIIIVASTLAITSILQSFKSQELQYHILVEQIKTMRSNVLKALIEEKRLEQSDSAGKTVFFWLDKAAQNLEEVEVALLAERAAYITRISGLISIFQDSFKTATKNKFILFETMGRISTESEAFRNLSTSISNNIDKEIADSQLYNLENTDTVGLQELKKSISYAANLNDQIILSINQDLFLENNVEKFTGKYDQAIYALKVQKKNIGLQTGSLKVKRYTDVSDQLSVTYDRFKSLVPELLNSFIESRKVSTELEDYERLLTDSSDSLVKLALALRDGRNKTATITLVVWQSFFFIFLLFAGLLFGRSITKPLSALVQVANSLLQDSKEKIDFSALAKIGRTIDVSKKNEISLLAKSFEVMGNEIQRKIIQLQENENHLNITLNSIGDAVIATDAEGLITFMNPVAEVLTGWPEVEAAKTPLSDVFNIINGENREKSEDPVAKVLSTGLVIGLANHTVLIARDGIERQIADSGAPIRNADGDIIGVVLVFRDVSEEYQIREAQRKSEERYQKLFIESTDAIFVSSKDGKIIEVNPASITLLGYSELELKSLNTTDLYADKKDRETFIQEIESKGEVKNFKLDLRTKNNELKNCLMNATAKRADNGEIIGFQGTLHDVTNQKRLETQLRQAQKMDSIGALAGGIAHDFNNILVPLLGYAELLKSDLSGDGPSKEYADGIFKAAMRAKNLVNQILAVSRQGDQDLKPIRLQPIIKEALTLLRSSMPATIDIQHDLDPDCDLVTTDPTQIHQVVMNLATNAYHAMKETGGGLKLRLQQIQIESDKYFFSELSPGEYALLTVTDEGSGIEKHILERVFDPYFTTKEVGDGTGLGLSVVHGIIKSFNGAVRIYSELGIGTEVRVYLPITGREDDSIQIEKSSEPAKGGSEKILLVDDEDDVRSMEKQMLEQLGYQVTECAGSIEALEKFKADVDGFDLIFSDMTMPNMTGDQLAREVILIKPDMPIIICTGFSEKMNPDNMKDVGIKGCLMKPFRRSEMAGMVRTLLDNANIARNG